MQRIAIVGVLLVLGSCGAEPPVRPDHPVVVIGIDGLEPSIVAALLAEGQLPNLARFAEDGVVGRLGSIIPTYSPAIWTTIATGQPASVHGITGFIDPRNGNPFTSNARRVPAFWQLLSRAGHRVGVVGWWVTWPAEEVLGTMVASYSSMDQGI